MSSAAQRLLGEVLDLPELDRVEIVTQLLASLDGSTEIDAGWDSAWLSELDRRAKAADDADGSSAEWSDVRDGLLAELRAR
jgi:Putative addiction module component